MIFKSICGVVRSGLCNTQEKTAKTFEYCVNQFEINLKQNRGLKARVAAIFDLENGER